MRRSPAPVELHLLLELRDAGVVNLERVRWACAGHGLGCRDCRRSGIHPGGPGRANSPACGGLNAQTREYAACGHRKALCSRRIRGHRKTGWYARRGGNRVCTPAQGEHGCLAAFGHTDSERPLDTAPTGTANKITSFSLAGVNRNSTKLALANQQACKAYASLNRHNTAVKLSAIPQ